MAVMSAVNATTEGTSPVHRLDPRLKLGAVAALSVLSLHTGWRGLLVFSGLLLAAALMTGLSPARFYRDGRYLLALLAVVVIARALSTPGTALIRWGGFSVTREGLLAGGLISWRLLCVMAAAAVLVAATRAEMIAAAVAWFLKPLPWINGQRVGIQMALVIRFIPLIRHQSGVSLSAQRARCVDQLKNPVRRAHLMVAPLMRRVFLTADRMATAMAARCYSDQRTPPVFAPGAPDAAAVVILVPVALALLAF